MEICYFMPHRFGNCDIKTWRLILKPIIGLSWLGQKFMYEALIKIKTLEAGWSWNGHPSDQDGLKCSWVAICRRLRNRSWLSRFNLPYEKFKHWHQGEDCTNSAYILEYKEKNRSWQSYVPSVYTFVSFQFIAFIGRFPIIGCILKRFAANNYML